MDEDEVALGQAARKLLFGSEKELRPPSIVPAPERHVRVKVTMNIDGDVVHHFKERAKREGRPYQFLMNEALRDHIEGNRLERIALQVGELLSEDPSFIGLVEEQLRRRWNPE